jgi:hypothetical protein
LKEKYFSNFFLRRYTHSYAINVAIAPTPPILRGYVQRERVESEGGCLIVGEGFVMGRRR